MGWPKKTRSPGWSWSTLTCLKEAYWSPAECAITTPACRHEDIVSPEQSNDAGPEPAQTYGLPICAIAARTATAAWSDDGTDGKASDGEDPEDPDGPGVSEGSEGPGVPEGLAVTLATIATWTAAARSAAALAAAMRLASLIWPRSFCSDARRSLRSLRCFARESLIDRAWLSSRDRSDCATFARWSAICSEVMMPDCQSLTCEISSIFL